MYSQATVSHTGNPSPLPPHLAASPSPLVTPVRPRPRGIDPAKIARDVRLMERIRGGDQQAFARLHDLHATSVARGLRGLAGSLEEAEEIVQEAFLQLWQQADRFRPERATPRGWLVLLARSRALDRLRSQQARRRREEAAHREYFEAVEWVPKAASGLESEERRHRVAEAMQVLSDVQRRCLELAFFEDLSHRQIAEHLGQPLGTVKSRILLGMKKMRLALGAPNG